MKLNKPKFWDREISFFSIIFYPFSLLISTLIFLKKKFVKIERFNIPIVCVGNIYIGGTGKTPACLVIAEELKKIGKKPVIIRKYYKSHKDEHKLIRKYFPDFILHKNRISGILQAIEKRYDFVILDDGLQEYKIKKDLNIVCFSQKQLIGNGLIFPAGPLRESLEILKDVHVILINGKKDLNFEQKILKINKHLKIYYSNYRPENIDKFKNKNLFAVSGIGNPQNFFDLLVENQLNIKKKISFPDHYQFSKFEIAKICNEAEKNNLQIVMTEKDYLRIDDYDIPKLNFLKIKCNIDEKEKFLQRILEIDD